jgi:hypothetical protein
MEEKGLGWEGKETQHEQCDGFRAQNNSKKRFCHFVRRDIAVQFI